MDDFLVEISIPADDDGYILLQCPKCGEKFKLTSEDIQSEEVIDIYCPLCGLTSENFFTEDIVELAQEKTMNQVMKNLFNDMKDIERQTKNSCVKFKAGKYKEEYEKELFSTIDNMDVVNLECCNKTAKIRGLLKYSGYYCPYCGGKCNEDN